MKTLSIVVPVYCEEDNIQHFYEEICKVMQPLPYSFELIFVDDGSKDRSRELLLALEKKDERVQSIFLAKNYGHQIALTCGLDHADGDCVITMDGDMQHPPELIPTLLEKWNDGYQVVQTIRKTTEGVSFLKNVTSAMYYKVLNSLSQVHIQEGGSDFRLMDRRVVLAFRQYREHARFIRGMIGSMGYKQVQIEFTAPPRFAGVSKFSPKKMMNFAIDGIMAYSIIPLRFGLYIGGFCAFLSFFMMLQVLIDKFVFNDTVPGWTTLIICVLFFGGMQLMILGVMGEYIGRIMEEVKNRPLYLIGKDKPKDMKK